MICLCGFCQECIKNYGHEECSRMVKEMECKKLKEKGENKEILSTPNLIKRKKRKIRRIRYW